MAQKTIGGLGAATTPLDGTEKVEIEQSAVSKRTTVADLRGQGISAKTASYTILDVDADVFEFDGASADGTFTGPTLADNLGRVLEIHNVDPTYKLTFDPEGAETVDGNASIVLPSQYNYLRVRGGTSTWHVLGMKTNYDTGWIANSDWTLKTLTVIHNLATDLADLIVKFFVSANSDGSGALEVVDFARLVDATPGANTSDGVGFVEVDNNTIEIQTASQGMMVVQSGGGVNRLDTDAWYYKAKVYRFN